MDLSDIKYKKYRWFYTSTDKLVLGGKNAYQNDELLRMLKSNGEDFVIMHTELPGSPFSVILTDISKVNKSDKEECAIFTACFSHAWKRNEEKVCVHVFKLSNLHKGKSMKEGTWGALGKVEKIQVKLKLVLIKQKNVLRSVPEKSVKNKKEILLTIMPGKSDKLELIPKLILELNEGFSQAEILSALPAGGIKIIKNELRSN